MAHRDTSASELCRELGITPVTLYRYVGPQSQLREQGQKDQGTTGRAPPAAGPPGHDQASGSGCGAAALVGVAASSPAPRDATQTTATLSLPPTSQKKLTNSLAQIRRANLALPDREHPPSHPLQCSSGPGITFSVPPELWHPIRSIRLWLTLPPTTTVPMPEAPMDEHHRPMLRQHHIRCSWKVPTMKAEAVPQPVHRPPYDHFRPRIRGPHPRHEGAPFLARAPIPQRPSPLTHLKTPTGHSASLPVSVGGAHKPHYHNHIPPLGGQALAPRRAPCPTGQRPPSSPTIPRVEVPPCATTQPTGTPEFMIRAPRWLRPIRCDGGPALAVSRRQN